MYENLTMSISIMNIYHKLFIACYSYYVRNNLKGIMGPTTVYGDDSRSGIKVSTRKNMTMVW